MRIQFGRGEAFIASKAAAMNPFRDNHFGAAQPCDVDQGLTFAQMLGAAGDVYGNRLGLGGECQLIHKVGANEAHRIVQIEARFTEVLHQAQGAGAGVAIDRVKPTTAGV